MIKTFDSNVFRGASIETETLTEDDLARRPEVLRVWPNEVIELLPTYNERAADISEAPEYTTHNATGVSKLHAQGIYGAGVKVGVVDTGIYYTHEAVSVFFDASRRIDWLTMTTAWFGSRRWLQNRGRLRFCRRWL